MKGDVYAVMDFGSNTVTLAVYRMGEHDFRRVLKQKAALGILRYIHDGILSEDGIRLAVNTLLELRHIAETQTRRIYCFATASLRGVHNASNVLERIRQGAGLEVDLLSGEQEAYCDYLGLMRYIPGIRHGVALDIGGGSMEIIHIRSGNLHRCISLPTGSLKLAIDYANGKNPSPCACVQMEAGINELLRSIDWLPHCLCDTIYTIGGTARAVGKLQKAIRSVSTDSDHDSYPVADLNPLLLYLQDSRHHPRLMQIIPDRLLTIIPGVIALRAVANHAGTTTAAVSEYGIREGYLLGKVLSGGMV